MADLKQLLAEFAADYEAGRSADPAAFLDRADPGQRQELAALLDSYLMTAPDRRWDPQAFEGSLAQLAVDRVYDSVAGVSGSWPELLPQLRNRARIKRRALVEQLAAALGFESEPEVAKIGDYYNRMEHGRLPAAGVSARVIEALAAILDVGPERIRAAGSHGGGAGEATAAFARTSFPNVELADAEIAGDRAEEPVEPSPPAGRDEIDALFMNG